MESTKNYWLMDSWTMTQRQMKHLFRNLDSLFVSIGLPVVMMLLFVYVFGGAIETGTEYVNFVVPSVIVMCVGQTCMFPATGIAEDKTKGLFDRFRSMPLHPSSLLMGQVNGNIVRNLISTTLVILVAFLIGFRPEAGFLEWILIIGVLLLFTFSFSWLAIICGLLANSVEAASSITMIMIFLPYLSDGFVPVESMSNAIRVVAENQPMTPLIITLRALMLDLPLENNLWLTLIWLLFITIISITAATFLVKNFKK